MQVTRSSWFLFAAVSAICILGGALWYESRRSAPTPNPIERALPEPAAPAHPESPVLVETKSQAAVDRTQDQPLDVSAKTPASESSDEGHWRDSLELKYAGHTEAELRQAKESMSELFQEGLSEEARIRLDQGAYVELGPGENLGFDDVPRATPPYDNQFICRFSVTDDSGASVQRIVFIDPITLPNTLQELDREANYLISRVHDLDNP